MSGTLFIVSTPIGNLEDITLRALHILKEVDLIAAEDTRRSLKLLNHYGISKPIISYWGERERSRSEEVLRRLRSGLSVALVSDAGTPGISDPGAVLIRKAIEENIPVISIPGPSALIAALSLSGLSTEEFTFVGFLPAGKTQRRKTLEDLSRERRTLVFYEAPHRVLQLLEDMEKPFAGRKAAVVKEISKIHEHVLRGLIPEILLLMKEGKIAGEYVVVVEGNPGLVRAVTSEALAEIRVLMGKGLGRKEAVKKIAGEFGMHRKELYDSSLKEIP